MTRAFLIHTDKSEGNSKSAKVRVLCPRNITPEQIARLDAGQGSEFRLLDDDGEVYYLGRFLGDPNSEDAFAPLDCYGEPNAGCTAIQYRIAGRWTDL